MILELAAGTGVDAFLDRSTNPWTLREAVTAGPFSPGRTRVGGTLGGHASAISVA